MMEKLSKVMLWKGSSFNFLVIKVFRYGWTILALDFLSLFLSSFRVACYCRIPKCRLLREKSWLYIIIADFQLICRLFQQRLENHRHHFWYWNLQLVKQNMLNWTTASFAPYQSSHAFNKNLREKGVGSNLRNFDIQKTNFSFLGTENCWDDSNVLNQL